METGRRISLGRHGMPVGEHQLENLTPLTPPLLLLTTEAMGLAADEFPGPRCLIWDSNTVGPWSSGGPEA